jgi:hypothetical protein
MAVWPNQYAEKPWKRRVAVARSDMTLFAAVSGDVRRCVCWPPGILLYRRRRSAVLDPTETSFARGVSCEARAIETSRNVPNSGRPQEPSACHYHLSLWTSSANGGLIG